MSTDVKEHKDKKINERRLQAVRRRNEDTRKIDNLASEIHYQPKPRRMTESFKKPFIPPNRRKSSVDIFSDNELKKINSPETTTPKRMSASLYRKKILNFEIFASNEEDQEFIIPELPEGQLIVVDILSTWGDRHYVGLNGIEIFSSLGEAVSITKVI